LIDKEIEAGWVSEFHGTIDEAQVFRILKFSKKIENSLEVALSKAKSGVAILFLTGWSKNLLRERCGKVKY